MDFHLCLLLYSKYSPMSVKLLTAMQSSPIDLTSVINLKAICIDNEDIREQILTETKIDVSTVPCILIVYRNGGVEKYQGSNAFQWIEETVRKLMPQQPQQQPQQSQQQSQQSHQQSQQQSQQSQQQSQQSQQPQQQTKQRKKPPIQNPVYDDSSEEEYIQPKPIQKRVQKKQPKKSANKSVISIQKLSDELEDLDDEDEDDSNETKYRPPVGVRTGPNSYDMTDFPELQETNRDVSRHMKNSTAPSTGKGNNLMAAAMAMQKERDKVDSNKPTAIGEFVTTKRPL